MSKADLTPERLRHLVRYDLKTGVFTWRVNRTARAKAGSVAGTKNSLGYRQIGIDGHLHLAHRLAWLYVFGSHPKRRVLHINGVRDDNRFANLQ